MKEPKKLDIITLSIYAVIGIAILYFAAAIGTSLDLSVGENGKSNFNVFTENLNSTVSNYSLVFEHLRIKGSNAVNFTLLTAGGLAIFVLMKATDKHKFHRKGEEHGSARWATLKEKKSLLDKPVKKCGVLSVESGVNSSENTQQIQENNSTVNNVDVIHSPNSKLDNNIILTNDVKMSLNTRQTRKNLNVMVIGGSGSGKSRFYVKPNLMQANTSYVCTDPKGELLRSTGTFLERQGYRIKVFNLINMKNSHNYNPFAYVYDADKNYSETAVIKMVNVLMKNTKQSENGSGDQFWGATRSVLKRYGTKLRT